MSPPCRLADSPRRWPDGGHRCPTRSPPPKRSLARALAATAALTALLLSATAVPAFAASGTNAEPSRYVFDDDWCFDDGWQVNCFVTHGTLSVTVTPDGREMARIHFREDVHSFDESGVEIGSYQSHSLDRTVFANGGQDSTFEVSHVRSRADGSTCTYTYLLKIVDYELVKEELNGPSCS